MLIPRKGLYLNITDLNMRLSEPTIREIGNYIVEDNADKNGNRLNNQLISTEIY